MTRNSERYAGDAEMLIDGPKGARVSALMLFNLFDTLDQGCGV